MQLKQKLTETEEALKTAQEKCRQMSEDSNQMKEKLTGTESILKETQEVLALKKEKYAKFKMAAKASINTSSASLKATEEELKRVRKQLEEKTLALQKSKEKANALGDATAA